MPRIIAGTHRSRALETIEGMSTRPYTDRVKESVFNILRGHIEGANVLDLFSGIGTMGLEAASRGAASVLMVERDRRVFAALERNVEMLNADDVATAIQGDALSSLPILRSPRPLHIIFVDPPYAMMQDDGIRARILQQVHRVSELLDDGGFIVLRTPLKHPRVDHSIEGLAGPEVRGYQKQQAVLFYGREDSS
ncbi:MAG: 16S rRNA (guanine(966)-N(2))-methyltransferase RsmD [Phycisphaerales bacterium]|nr:16S rRNA (guanine(966)-N(2))-methyltransferase RsmD [Phycisphaerales bacterium]